MEAKKHLAQWHTDTDTGFRYRYVVSQNERFVTHTHDYYEVFLVIDGSVIHTVNGITSTLKRGNLTFIRPDDIHGYAYDGINNFCFANLAFNAKIASSLFEYLEGGCDTEILKKCEMPPTVNLTLTEADKLIYTMQTINTAAYSSTSEKILKMKSVLFEIFSKYFSKYSHSDNKGLVWFDYLCEELKKPKSFQKQHPDMCSICGKTKEHIARTFKKQLGITASEYLNEVRLNFAANLLKNTDMSVLEISLESGFENLSWFYRKFNDRFGVTPKQFREQK